MTHSVEAQTPPILARISFSMVLLKIRTLLDLAPMLGNALSEDQFKTIAENLAVKVAQNLSPERRKRQCPRAVRQRMKHWPKIVERNESEMRIKINLN